MNINTDQLNLKVDFNNLYDLTEGKKDLLINLLQVLAKNLKAYPKEMKEMEASKDWDALRASAHKYKSSIAYLAHDSFVDVLNKLEASVENRSSEKEITAWVEKTRLYSEAVLEQVTDKMTELILS